MWPWMRSIMPSNAGPSPLTNCISTSANGRTASSTGLKSIDMTVLASSRNLSATSPTIGATTSTPNDLKSADSVLMVFAMSSVPMASRMDAQTADMRELTLASAVPIVCVETEACSESEANSPMPSVLSVWMVCKKSSMDLSPVRRASPISSTDIPHDSATIFRAGPMVMVIVRHSIMSGLPFAYAWETCSSAVACISADCPPARIALLSARNMSADASTSPFWRANRWVADAAASSVVGSPSIPAESVAMAREDASAEMPTFSMTRGKVFSVSIREMPLDSEPMNMFTPADSASPSALPMPMEPMVLSSPPPPFASEELNFDMSGITET